MARAHVDSSDEDDDLPSLAHLLQRPRPAPTPSARANTPKLVPKIKNDYAPTHRRVLNRSTFGPKPRVDTIVANPTPAPLRKQTDAAQECDTAIKRTPRRAATARVNHRSPDPSDAEDVGDGNSLGSPDDSEDMEQSIWCGDDDEYSREDSSDPDSDSDLSTLEPTRQRLTHVPKKDIFESNPWLDSPRRRLFAKKDLRDCASNPGLDDIFKKPLVPISLVRPSHVDRPTSSSSADNDAILKYSPPRRKSPCKVPDASKTTRASTPPPPTSPIKLNSPTKKMCIPTAPHRESVDAFWAADVVNDWNDRHSPRKKTDPSASPVKKSPVRSPVKKDKAAIAKRKMFEERKHKLAREFLDELDKTIEQGKVGRMTADYGGIKIEWSKTLLRTAGRANWAKRDGKHNAKIELAEKIIEDEYRLFNTLAHEFCHLLTFMISDMRDNPHGKEFQGWGRKVSAAFTHRGVDVTTKHNYEIDYKYVWTCTGCGNEHKRHSKSIDPAKSVCGVCRGKLEQTQPVPRQGQVSEYQLFMKANFNRIKSENAGKSHAVIMELVGKEYREMKAKKDLSDLTDAFKSVELED